MTIGVNISHDSSICIKDSDTIKFFEESRFSKNKYWEPTKEDFIFSSFKNINNFDDTFVFSSYDRENNEDEEIIKNICKKYKIKNYFFNSFSHHLYHACSGFYASSFNNALCVVVDGHGSRLPQQNTFQEVDSIYFIDNTSIKPKYKNYSNAKYSTLWSNFDDRQKLLYLINQVWENLTEDKLNNNYFVENDCLKRMTSFYNPGLLFNHLCATLHFYDKKTFQAKAGEAMGLSSYGKNYGKRDEDLCKQVQEATEKYTIELIEKALTYSDTRNIVLSGGYFLNCVNNYKYTQYFKNINFFIDPCPHDGGTALGAAVWYDYYR